MLREGCPGGLPASAPSTASARWRPWWSTRRPANATRLCGTEAQLVTEKLYAQADVGLSPMRSLQSRVIPISTWGGRSSAPLGRPPSTSARWRRDAWMRLSTSPVSLLPPGTISAACSSARRPALLLRRPKVGTCSSRAATGGARLWPQRARSFSARLSPCAVAQVTSAVRVPAAKRRVRELPTT